MAAISSHNPSMEVDIAPESQQVFTLAKEAVQNETDGLYNDSALLWRQAASILVAYANANIDPDEVGIVTKVKSLIGCLVSRAIQNNNVKQLEPNYLSLKIYQDYIAKAMDEIAQSGTESDQSDFAMREPNEIKAPNLWDLSGQEDVRDLIVSLFAAKNNVMVFGPPGTGKTFMAASLAKSYNLLFIEVNSANLMSAYVGGTEKNIKNLFELAHRKVTPDRSVLIFFDEAEAILSTRKDSPINTNPVTQFMIEMEKDTNKGVHFFFTTNLLSKIEPAIKRRCYGLFIGYPKTKEAIASLYRHNLANFKNTVSDQTIETLTTANDKLLSPSAIASIVKLASTLANKITTNDKFRRVRNHLYIKDPNGSYTFADVSKQEGKPITKHILEIVPINDNHLINAWRATPSAITAEELEHYKDEAKELLQLKGLEPKRYK
ncbi:unnamed protein product [Ceutorhynchus assimilis]|uniref:AAA+ ATPase domain-containing protein n=1 Tax=Ceutorhynchus assimilis TaxID=467358 RepID=A0A9N9MX81_9CUCU|nr:unnamed protein product [Ceutorhynchus assimilis]